MKKYVLLLFIILLLPIMVNAEDRNIVLESISLNEKSENVEEITPATIEDGKIVLDFKMYEVEDYIEYKVKVKNNSKETLEVDQSSLANINYVKYSVDSTSIKGGEEKEILLRITYQNKVADKDFFSAKYINQDKIPLVFKSPTIINPETIRNILPIILIIGIMIGYSIYNKKKINLSKAMIILLLLGLIPNIASALEEEIILESNIMIRKVKPTHCTFDGELVQGAEYTNGQYTYRYMQEKNGLTDWSNIETEGWGVVLTDRTSTEDVTSTLCSTINDKPLVSTKNMFSVSGASNIDTSSFDTEEVTNMHEMFSGCIRLTSLDLNSLDTSKVNDMYGMFAGDSNLFDLDVSNWDTSTVTNMYAMFHSNSSLNQLDLSNWDTSKVNDMYLMFYGCSSLTSLDLSNWNTSAVTDMAVMFYGCSSLTSLDLSSFDTSNVTVMYDMFSGCSNLTSLDLSNFDTSNVTNMDDMFNNCTSLTTAYGRTQADCNKFNNSSNKPANVNFVVKS